MRPQTPGRPDHAAPRPPFAKRARKFLVGTAGLAAQVLTSGVLDGADQTAERLWLQAALAVATAAGIYQARNARPS